MTKAEHKTQVLRVRDLLQMAAADLREAIAQNGLLPNTEPNRRTANMANSLEAQIRELEARVIGVNQEAFSD